MPVTDQNEQYKNNKEKWDLVRACDEGACAIKAGKEKYLPKPNAEDTSDANKKRYRAYIERANFVNFTAHTKEGMLGMVFRKETKIETPTETEYLIENINGDGLSADQMIKDVSGDVLLTGRYGLLAEYPQADAGMTVAQVEALSLRANIKPYPAESVLNWRTMTVGGVTKLSMVVLCEPTEVVNEDGFGSKIKDYHRVLLMKGGVYVQNLYNEADELIVWETEEEIDGVKVNTGDIIPNKADGKPWAEIPFIFVGSENNDPSVDKSPLYDIAEINVAHYRNSADFEESSFMVGQPTPYVAGLSQSWVDENYKDGLSLGSRGGLMLPEGGSAGLLQADPNQMPEKGMEMKEAQMVKVGTRIIQDKTGNETAEAAKIRFAGQNSKLGSLLVNVESAFEKAIDWCGEFMGATNESDVEINKELYDMSVDPQLLIAQIQLLDRGVIAKTDLRSNLRGGGLIKSDRTDEEVDNDAEQIDII